MNKNKKVTIIGAGWLGAPLALSLFNAGESVVATKQSQTTLAALKTKFSEKCPDFNLTQNLHFCLFSEEILQKETESANDYPALFSERKVIITIPPTPFIRRYSQEDAEKGVIDYANFIKKIHDVALESGALEILYTSSTSVYGNSSGIIHEELPAMPQTLNAKAIHQAEKVLLQSPLPITILRLGGLIGHGRHPILTLQGKTGIQTPFNAINLVHITDVISAITVILQRPKRAQEHQIYNLVSPTHPNRMSYYQSIAHYLGLIPPQFEAPKPLLKRIIDGEKITEKGDFNYQITDLVHASLQKII